MRRVWIVVIAMSGLVLGGGTQAAARQPNPAPPPSPGPAPDTVCTISDTRLHELSGLVAVANGYVAINDSQDDPSAMKVVFLDAKCAIKKQFFYPTAAKDPEDVAVARDGTIWVADVGDNLGSQVRRDTIALWKVPAAGGTPVIHRVSYPDGKHDAEALVMNGDGTPVIVTKEPTGPAQLYAPSGALQPNARNGVQLKQIGTFTPGRTGTPNPLGAPGQNLVTGGANSPDGKRVALRTYSDAYEWDVPDGDVVKAITTGRPRITPLPNEAQGEAIAYTTDGASFLTVTDATGPTKMLKYAPAKADAALPTKDSKTKAAATRPWYKPDSLPEILNIVAGVGAFGLLLVVIGVVGIRRSRTKRRNAAQEEGLDAATAATAATASGGEDDRPTAVLTAVSDRPGGAGPGTVYGGSKAPAGRTPNPPPQSFSPAGPEPGTYASTTYSGGRPAAGQEPPGYNRPDRRPDRDRPVRDRPVRDRPIRERPEGDGPIRDARGRDGTGRDSAGRGGAGRDGVGRDGVGRDGVGRGGPGQGGVGRDGVGRDGVGRGGPGQGGVGRDGLGRERPGSDRPVRERPGRDRPGPGPGFGPGPGPGPGQGAGPGQGPGGPGPVAGRRPGAGAGPGGPGPGSGSVYGSPESSGDPDRSDYDQAYGTPGYGPYGGGPRRPAKP